MIAKLSTSFSNLLNPLGLRLVLQNKRSESESEILPSKSERWTNEIERMISMSDFSPGEIDRLEIKNERLESKSETLTNEIERMILKSDLSPNEIDRLEIKNERLESKSETLANKNEILLNENKFSPGKNQILESKNERSFLISSVFPVSESLPNGRSESVFD